MTRLAFMSDLHIDLNQFGTFEVETLIACLKQQKIDWLHITGDISNHYHKISLPFLKRLGQELRVTHNLGNHDMLDMTEEQIKALDFQRYEFKNCVFIACHGWYDYSFSDRSKADILSLKKRFWFDRRLNRPLTDPEQTAKILHDLESLLQQESKPIILSMHFVPHQEFTLTHETFRPFNAFLGSQSFHHLFKQYGVAQVIFGHSHHSHKSQIIDGVTYQSSPLGYIREWDATISYVSNHPHLNPTGTWNLSKRYNLVKKNPDFQAFLKKELATELTNSMIIFDIDD